MRDLWFGNQNSVGLDNVGPSFSNNCVHCNPPFLF
jgi:hypothetical protein